MQRDRAIRINLTVLIDDQTHVVLPCAKLGNDLRRTNPNSRADAILIFLGIERRVRVKAEDLFVHGLLMGIICTGIPRPDWTSLFLDFIQGFVIQFLLRIDSRQMTVCIVHFQGLTIWGGQLEMVIQFFPVVTLVQCLLHRLSQFIIFHASHMDGVVGLIYCQPEGGWSFNIVLGKNVLNGLADLFPAGIVCLYCSRSQCGRTIRESKGIAHLQMLSTIQQVQLLVIGPGPLIL